MTNPMHDTAAYDAHTVKVALDETGIAHLQFNRPPKANAFNPNDGGALFIAGRARDVIKRSGYNVYPLDIEAALYAHPRWRCAASSAGPRGSMRNWWRSCDSSRKRRPPSDLRRFLEERLAGHKLPNVIQVLTSLPTLDSGKLDRASITPNRCFGRRRPPGRMAP
ncbi:MAG: hypothetical protein ACT4P3_17555 [Betaproteobacteria bacterium]